MFSIQRFNLHLPQKLPRLIQRLPLFISRGLDLAETAIFGPRRQVLVPIPIKSNIPEAFFPAPSNFFPPTLMFKENVPKASEALYTVWKNNTHLGRRKMVEVHEAEDLAELFKVLDPKDRAEMFDHLDAIKLSRIFFILFESYFFQEILDSVIPATDADKQKTREAVQLLPEGLNRRNISEVIKESWGIEID